eukprot:GHRR01035298.1.p1 GENE.GHRR01035298.1~~GHRR01035298.1.p1  ORF type:complete len:139 (-),score=30.10 GHRR01035298.1:338-754(-)
MPSVTGTFTPFIACMCTTPPARQLPGQGAGAVAMSLIHGLWNCAVGGGNNCGRCSFMSAVGFALSMAAKVLVAYRMRQWLSTTISFSTSVRHCMCRTCRYHSHKAQARITIAQFIPIGPYTGCHLSMLPKGMEYFHSA